MTKFVFNILQFVVWCSAPCQPVSAANRLPERELLAPKAVNDLVVTTFYLFLDVLNALGFFENPLTGEYAALHREKDAEPIREVIHLILV